MRKILGLILMIFIWVNGTADESKVQFLKFDDGTTLEGKEMRPSIELVVDPGEVFGKAVFIESLDVQKVAEKGISDTLLEEIK